jgi:hypothetical protein
MSRAHVVFDERGEVTEYELRCSDGEASRGWRAMMLAPTPEICQALLRGESVPPELLNAEWRARFGRRSP